VADALRVADAVAKAVPRAVACAVTAGLPALAVAVATAEAFTLTRAVTVACAWKVRVCRWGAAAALGATATAASTNVAIRAPWVRRERWIFETMSQRSTMLLRA
jgi:hypothetical protein